MCVGREYDVIIFLYPNFLIMTKNKYKYALVDLSYILARNAYMVAKNKKPGEYTPGEIIRLCIWSINKIPRDYNITADKFILVSDKWDESIGGYYTTYMLKGNYKSDRGDQNLTKGHGTYITNEVYEEMKKDPSISKSDLEAAEGKLYFNNTKQAAKYGMIKDLGSIGIPSILLPGWEYDNLAWLATNILYKDQDSKKSVLVTGDSDLLYSLSPKMDYFKLPLKGKNPKVVTYDEMYDTIPDDIKGKISLYNYHAMLDSLGEGHNMMRRTKISGTNGKRIVESLVLKGESSFIQDPELFRLQYGTFDITKYPGYDRAVELISSLSKIGHYGNIDDFHKFIKKYNISGISDKYYSDFIERFDQKLFSE